MKHSLGISNFIQEISVFLILLFSSIYFTDHWGRLSFLAALWSSAFRWVCICFSPLPFSAICKVSSDNHIAVLHFFFLGMVLIVIFCTVVQTCTHISFGIQSVRPNLVAAVLGGMACWHKSIWRRLPLPLPKFGFRPNYKEGTQPHPSAEN